MVEVTRGSTKLPGCVQAVIRRGQMVEGPEGPIVVCTRNDALEDVVNATPEERRRGERTTNCFNPAHPHTPQHLQRATCIVGRLSVHELFQPLLPAQLMQDRIMGLVRDGRGPV